MTLKDLLNPDRWTILAGAGCSIDAPSCQPSGNAMINAIVRFACPPSEVEKILALREIRFEALVEAFRDAIDPELRLIDYFAQCDRPNLQHFFLAEMLRRGHFVVTTNFDLLVERALLASGAPPDNVCPVITRADFENVRNPQSLFEAGKLLVIKLHGSTFNAISGENTRQSLIATIQALGSEKEGLDIFQVEPYKQALVHQAFEDRTVVVLGYSGSDDFDVVPTLMALPNLRNLVWVNHVQESAGARLVEVETVDGRSDAGADKVQQILIELKRRGSCRHVYRADINTSSFVREFVDESRIRDLDDFTGTPQAWLAEHIPVPMEIERHAMAYRIYREQRELVDALLQCMAALKIADESNALEAKATLLNNMGSIYQMQRDTHQAVKAFQQSIQLLEQVGQPRQAALIRGNLGSLFYEQNKYEDAWREYQRALPVFETEPASVPKGILLGNLGALLAEDGKADEALPRLMEALKVLDEVGGLRQKAMTLANIGAAHDQLGHYDDADRYWSVALEVHQQLFDRDGKVATIWMIAQSLASRGNLEGSLERLLEGFGIARELPWSSRTLEYQMQIANTLVDLKRYDEAFEYWEQIIQFMLKRQDYSVAVETAQGILPIAEETGDPAKLASLYHALAAAYQGAGKFTDAIHWFEKMIPLLTKNDERAALAVVQNNIGGCYLGVENYAEAYRWFLASLQAQADTASHPAAAVTLMNVGIAALKMGELDEAVIRLERARAAFEEMNDRSSEYYRSAAAYLEFARQMQRRLASGQDITEPISKVRLRPIQSGVAGDLSHGMASVRRGQEHMRREEFAEAQRCFEEAHRLFHDLGAREHIAITRRHLGEAHFAQEEYEEAIRQWIGAQLDFEELGDSEAHLQTCHALGVVHERLGRLAEAAHWYQEAYITLRETGDQASIDAGAPAIVEKLAALYDALGEHSRAEVWVKLAADEAMRSNRVEDAARYLERLIELSRQLDLREDLAYASNNAGNAHRLLGNYPLALERFEQAVSLFEALGKADPAKFSRDMIDQVRRALHPQG
jgi:tetratricopeptide (TPR) repeat protein